MNVTSMRRWLACFCCIAGIHSLGAAPVTFTNATKINVPMPPGTGSSTGAVSEPYPSSINVNGLNGRVSGVAVKLRSVTHTFPGDMDIMLVHSDTTGQSTNIVLLSDAGSGTDVSNVTLIFRTGVATAVPTPIVGGTYHPTNAGTSDPFPGAPTPSGATSLDVFQGRDPNGTWSLYVVDDTQTDAGSIDGWELTLDTTFAPFITAQPTSQVVSNGGTVTFGVNAVGASPLRYQWRWNCRDIPSATNSTFTISNVNLAHAGNYSVTVMNGSGHMTSADATLALNRAILPRIAHAIIGTSNLITWPKFDVHYEIEETTTLNRDPLGNIPWSTVSEDSTFNSSNYSVLVPRGASNRFFRAASSTVRILSQPRGQSANFGDVVTLSVTATGAPPLSYQWRLNGFALIGQTNPTITVSLDRVANFGAYQVTVQDAHEALSSGPAVIRLNGIETILADQFAAKPSFSNDNNTIHGTTFNATSEAGEPLHAGTIGGRSVWLTWHAPSNGYVTFDTRGSGFDTLLAAYANVPGVGLTAVASDDDTGGNLCSVIQFNATAGTDYAIAIDGVAGAAGYFVLNWDFTPSAFVTLPVIDIQPQDKTVTPGSAVTFFVSAHGTGQLTSLSYQWLFNGTPISGARGTSLDLGGGSPAPALPGLYSVLVSNSVLGIQSRSASLQFSSSPEFRFVPKLLVDVICGLDPIRDVNAPCCSAKPSNPKLLTGSAGTLAGALNSGGCTPGSVCTGRTYWMWVTNGWACSKTVTLTGAVYQAGSPIAATLAVYDENSVFVKKCNSNGSGPAKVSFSTSSGRMYWIALGFDSLSATGALTYTFGGNCP